MKSVRVLLERTDTYHGFADIEVPDDFTDEQIKQHVNNRLSSEGWDGFIPDDDGDYEECETNFVRIAHDGER